MATDAYYRAPFTSSFGITYYLKVETTYNIKYQDHMFYPTSIINFLQNKTKYKFISGLK